MTGKMQRRPVEIIGYDALTQLAFEGYEVVPFDSTPSPDVVGALEKLADAYVALLIMKAEDPSRFQEPGSPYAEAKRVLASLTEKERG